VPVALLVSGEELHNNHHRWPRSAKFSMKWWEIDAGWMLIRSLAAVGLASDIYVRNKRWKPSGDPVVDPVDRSESGLLHLGLGDITDAQLPEERAVDPSAAP